MKESYGEGVANHTGLQPCAVVREDGGEASAEVRAGRVFSREKVLPRGADVVAVSGRQHPLHRYREMQRSHARSKTSCMYGNSSHGNREIPRSPAAEGAAGRTGKSKDVRR